MHRTTLLGMLALATAAVALPSASSQQQTPEPGSASSISNLKNNIKNVVWLIMENRSFDNLLGGQKHEGLENPIQNGPYCNPYNVSKTCLGKACSQARDYDSVKNDPSHAVSGNTMEFYSTWTPDNAAIADGTLKANNLGFITEQYHNYGSKVNITELAIQVMNYYTEDQVPVMTSLVQNFLTFNHWHSDVAGPTDPNRLAATSGSSHGHGTNLGTDYTYQFDVPSIFEAVGERNLTWLNYWDTAGGTGPEAKAYTWTQATNNSDKVVPITQFYTDALAGNLPAFSYLNPSCCGIGTTSMHDSGLISDGEAFIKKVYESLRAGPQWENSLFILTFDESGGFHDHVPPPLAPRPDNLTYTETTPNGLNYTYEFNRLGGRIPTFLISPWIAEGEVEQYGTNHRGETVSYCASSILRTLGYLWDFEPFTPRVEWAPSFDHLIQKTSRKDVVSTLPNPSNFTAPYLSGRKN
ncbi:putative phosphoesterase superfamily protein [Phaeoacremonium minimum UCRPA7]|uniref:Putative phosphoesterase superfamily protein n=1 Tax=Phaeoacremonium minimum (strain UCR-PA7) TaxID=1286976 RepID=R8BTH4_PHAM7|nr:putative phosphoesterase superfamily protein [Phaeoacremonium minimum UCRPA7]EOO02651.1 putative phosphoesterase superfamily protein [Phaeoacremonium minimum UCRPA7]